MALRFDAALEKFTQAAMSSASAKENSAGFAKLLPLATFQTMASPAADAAILAAWPEAATEENGGDDDADEAREDVEETIQQELVRELPRAPLRSAMRKPRPVPRNDDEDGDVAPVRAADGDDDEENNNNNNDAQPAEDDEDGAARAFVDDESDEEQEEEPAPLLPEFNAQFSSSDDGDLSSVGGFEDDDSDNDNASDREWLSARDMEPEGDSVGKRQKTKRAPAHQPKPEASGGKRKRAVPANGGDVDETQAHRKALAQHKSEIKAKMTSEEQLQTMQTYIKVAAVDHVMECEHKETAGSGDDEEYKSFRALVLEEATASGDEEFQRFALAIASIEADISATIAGAKRSEPDSMQLLLDFLADTTDVKFDAAAVAPTASRCDVTLQASAPEQLLCASATPRGAPDAARRLVMRSTLKNLASYLWTLTNFYAIVRKEVAAAFARMGRQKPPPSVADGLATIEADVVLAERLRKKLGEAHTKVCWHVEMSMKKK